MKDTKVIVKNLKLISFIMIVIHFLGLIYQLFTAASILAIIIKCIYILLFTLFILTLNKKVKIAPFIGIAISTITILISIKYIDLASILVSLIIAYYSYKLFLCTKISKKI